MATNREITLTGPGSAEALISGSYLSAYVTAIEWSPEVPEAGNINIYYRATDSEPWRPFRAGARRYDNGEQRVGASAKGHVVSQLRVVTEGTPAGSTVTVRFYLQAFPDTALDERVYGGNMAVNVQDFVESNVKNGSQWEVSLNPGSTIASGSSAVITIQTGSRPVLIKGVIPTIEFATAELTLYRAPTLSGLGPATKYNPNDINQATNEATVQTGVITATTGYGTQVSPVIQLLGDPSTSQEQRTPTTSVRGFERVLRTNTLYAIRMHNASGTAGRGNIYVTWYEGDLSTDL